MRALAPALSALPAALATLALAAFGSAALPDPAAAQRAETRELTCNSSDFGEKLCPAGGRVRSAVLIDQRSRARCIEGASWGVRGDSVWVSQGCRAAFRVIVDPGRRGGVIGIPELRGGEVACNSNDYARRRCEIPLGANWVRLEERRSNAACVWGESWGARPGEVWVDRGCAGRFGYRAARARPAGGGWEELRLRDRDDDRRDDRRDDGRDDRRDDGGVWRAPGEDGVWREGPRRAPAPAPRPRRDDWDDDWDDDRRDDGRRADGVISLIPGVQIIIGGGERDDDRYDNRAERFERREMRRAIRACRRFAEDNPDRLDAFWVEAASARDFRIESVGQAWRVEGPFTAWRRGRETLEYASCRVRDGVITAFRRR
ncbi:DUF3011 domain-containing protein [Rhodovulum sp. DZ06]|uniref:DUF3011 domain-containing protein n=1 Tax=Rhodovulum sp. DZ06 TaxID=3425126 RepID=UPI003D34D632